MNVLDHLWKETRHSRVAAILCLAFPSPCPASSVMANAIQRPLKGSRISTFYPVKSLPALSILDSAFQLQEFISLTIRSNIHDVSAIISIPDTRTNPEAGSDDNDPVLDDEGDVDRDSKGEFAVDEACWIYEQLRCAPVLTRIDKNSQTLTRIAP
jgi:hypothetical protein